MPFSISRCVEQREGERFAEATKNRTRDHRDVVQRRLSDRGARSGFPEQARVGAARTVPLPPRWPERKRATQGLLEILHL